MAEEVGGRFRRAPDARNLGDAMRLDRELEAGLDDRAGDRAMPAPGAQRRDRALVVPVRIAERILRQVGVMEFRLGEIGHEVTFIGFTVSLSRWSPISFAVKRAGNGGHA